MQPRCRPDYRQIGTFRSNFPGVPVTALTATATDSVRRDITRTLRFGPTAAAFKASFFRNNLFIRVCNKGRGADAFTALAVYLKALPHNAAAIVYCSSRRLCEEMAEDLQNEGLSAAHYHAGMTGKRRHEAQTKWQQGALRLLSFVTLLHACMHACMCMRRHHFLCLSQQRTLCTACCRSALCAAQLQRLLFST